MGIVVRLEGAIEEFHQHLSAVPLTISQTISDHKSCIWKYKIGVTKKN